MLLLNECVVLLLVLLVSFLGIGSIWVLDVKVLVVSRVVFTSVDAAVVVVFDSVGTTVVFCCSILEANSSENKIWNNNRIMKMKTSKAISHRQRFVSNQKHLKYQANHRHHPTARGRCFIFSHKTVWYSVTKPLMGNTCGASAGKLSIFTGIQCCQHPYHFCEIENSWLCNKFLCSLLKFCQMHPNFRDPA